MSNGYVIPVDPQQLACRHSGDNSPTEDDSDESIRLDNLGAMAPLFSSVNFEKEISPLLERIPSREADLIIMYYIQKKRQADIAAIFGVTQAAVSYRLDRGLQRIRFLLSIPRVTEEDLRKDLPLIFKDIDVDILVGMWVTTCQSEVAIRLGLTQGRVRHRFFRAVETLEAMSQVNVIFEPYHKIFSSIARKRFNILREVKLPQWAGRDGNGCF